MPVVTIDMYEGRTVEQKKALVDGITREITKVLGCGPEAVTIIIKDNPKHNWGSSGKLASG